MRGLGIFGALPSGRPSLGNRAPVVLIDDIPVRGAMVAVREPRFDPHRASSRRQVLVRVRAFSCNFRDKGFFVRMRRMPAHQFIVIGSEFAGVVEVAGADVTGLAVGDRVIGQNAYAGPACTEPGESGLPTNHSSREYLVLHERALARVPEAMPDAVAAAFGVGAQTAFSMIRRAAPPAGAIALVPSATSNTSLSLIAALRHRQVRVVAATATTGVDDRLHSLGVDTVVHTGGTSDAFRSPSVIAACQASGGVDYIFDPFFDLHLDASVAIMKPFGVYVTCGLAAQNAGAAARGCVHPLPAESIVRQMILKNLTLMGNCLGTPHDLACALRAYAAGTFGVVIDSVHRGGDAASFLTRTYADPSRFGKVVFAYDGEGAS
jgi:NADPH:quinone reductase-like Zn-dependent oxidoreductase